MGRKKRLDHMVDAVQGILGSSVKKKKLKKAKAMKRFIEKMESTRKQLQEELKSGHIDSDRKKLLTRHIETLDKQLKKAGKILKEMES